MDSQLTYMDGFETSNSAREAKQDSLRRWAELGRVVRVEQYEPKGAGDSGSEGTAAAA